MSLNTNQKTDTITPSTGTMTVSGNIIGPSAGFTIIGGTSTTADLTFQTTSGVGATGADIHFLVGNNGAIEAFIIYNSGVASFNRANSSKVVTLTDGATPALDASLGNIFYLSAGGDRTIAVPTNPTSGQIIVIRQYANGGARTIAFNAGAGGFRLGDFTISATASGTTDYITAIWNEVDSFWDITGIAKNY